MKINKYIYILILLLFFNNKIFSVNTGVINTHYIGELGNQLFIFAFSKIISHELKMPLIIDPIPGFPNTYGYNKSQMNHSIPTQNLQGHKINFNEIINDKSDRNISIFGFFHRYEYYKNYKELIRKDWLSVDNPYPSHKNLNDIILHVRIGRGKHENLAGCYLSFEYYEKILNSAKYENIYICTDNPNDKFLEKFKKYNPIIYHKSSLEDFKFIMSFNKIVVSQSTFGWWAAFLSNAKEIYMPKPNHGYMSNERPDLNYIVDDEERYKYIEISW